MTFSNGKKIVLLRLTGFISTVIYVLYIFLAYFPRIFRNVMDHNTINVITFILTGIYLIILIWPAIMKYRYVYFSCDEKMITLRWYKTGIIPGESSSIEIPADKFAGYKITDSFIGLHHHLILSQFVQGRKASYKPVSISALSKSQRDSIAEALKPYISAD